MTPRRLIAQSPNGETGALARPPTPCVQTGLATSQPAEQLWFTWVLARAQQLSFIYFASMPDSRHLYKRFCLVDGVHRAVVTHANAPLAIAAF
jgi:hypothetical protein